MRCKSLKTCFIVGILGVLLALSLVLWMGCESDVPSKPEAAEETTVYGAPPQNVIDRVMAIQDRHTPRLMAIPGVVGTATGLGPSGRPAVMVLTEKSGVAGIPGVLDSVPVIVKVTGEIRALKPPSDKPGKPPELEPEPVDPTARFDRPVPTGVSTGHPNITAGTIGCRVTDGTNVYALSNNHVYADENQAIIGDNVLQPGTYDGGIDPTDAIGTLADFELIQFLEVDPTSTDTIDAAIALSSTANLGNATPSDGYGTPKSQTVAPSINLPVQKYGRTTGLTKGKIYAVNATVDVGYGSRTARFTNQIVITPGSFSAGGDSGSLVVIEGKGRNKNDDRKPVGLLFAGSTLYTIANPIDAVLDRFGVAIDGE
jgi:hypothetical protein